MRKVALYTFALAAVFAAITPARAQNILFWTDFNAGTNQMTAALAALPGSYTVTTATSDTDFATQLSGGTFQLAILHIQGNAPSTYPTAIAAFSTFFAGGGKVLYTEWGQDSAYAAQFGATFTGNNNDTAFTVTAGNLLPGVSTPVSLTNPGWGIFSTGLSPNLGSTVMATFNGTGQAAITLDSTGRAYVNGFLNDTFTTGSDGVNLYTNEITSLFAAVPEPSTVALCGLAGVGALYAKWRRVRKNRAEKC